MIDFGNVGARFLFSCYENGVIKKMSEGRRRNTISRGKTFSDTRITRKNDKDLRLYIFFRLFLWMSVFLFVLRFLPYPLIKSSFFAGWKELPLSRLPAPWRHSHNTGIAKLSNSGENITKLPITQFWKANENFIKVLRQPFIRPLCDISYSIKSEKETLFRGIGNKLKFHEVTKLEDLLVIMNIMDLPLQPSKYLWNVFFYFIIQTYGFMNNF